MALQKRVTVASTATSQLSSNYPRTHQFQSINQQGPLKAAALAAASGSLPAQFMVNPPLPPLPQPTTAPPIGLGGLPIQHNAGMVAKLFSYNPRPVIKLEHQGLKLQNSSMQPISLTYNHMHGCITGRQSSGSNPREGKPNKPSKPTITLSGHQQPASIDQTTLKKSSMPNEKTKIKDEPISARTYRKRPLMEVHGVDDGKLVKLRAVNPKNNGKRLTKSKIRVKKKKNPGDAWKPQTKYRKEGKNDEAVSRNVRSKPQQTCEKNIRAMQLSAILRARKRRLMETTANHAESTSSRLKKQRSENQTLKERKLPKWIYARKNHTFQASYHSGNGANNVGTFSSLADCYYALLEHRKREKLPLPDRVYSEPELLELEKLCAID